MEGQTGKHQGGEQNRVPPPEKIQKLEIIHSGEAPQ